MRSRHLNNLISDRLGIGISKTEEVMRSVWEAILCQLANGEVVTMAGFGSFMLVRGKDDVLRVELQVDPALTRKVLIGNG